MRSLPLVLLAACGVWGASVVAHGGAAAAARTAPRLLSQTGLYLPGSLTIDPRNRSYTPQYPLWSDGAAKSRWVYIPPGAAIDGHDDDAWEFPVGTRFWKQFSFAGRKVETRLLWRSSSHGWTFATYVWNDTQSDAVLAPDSGVPDVLDVAQGRRHTIPGVVDCRACHESTRVEVLGFTPLQLSTDRDPGALHAEAQPAGAVTLQTLVDEGLLTGPAAGRLLDDPPRIRADNPRTRAALGYLSANCGSCHVGKGPLANLGLTLRQETRGPAWTDAAVVAMLARPTRWQRPGGGESGTSVVTPGSPEHSALLYRARSRRPSSQMPPLGTVLADRAAIELLTRWIRDDLSAGSSSDGAGVVPPVRP